MHAIIKTRNYTKNVWVINIFDTQGLKFYISLVDNISLSITRKKLHIAKTIKSNKLFQLLK